MDDNSVIDKDTPIEAQRLAVQCYINLQNYHVSMQAMLNKDFVNELLNILQRIDIGLKIMSCTALSGLMTEQISKELFTSGKGEEDGFYVLKRLKSPFPTLRALAEAPAPHQDPVFVCNFQIPNADSSLEINVRASKFPLMMSKPMSFSNRNVIRDDPHLRTYLLRLRMWFGDPAKSLHYFEIDDAHYEVRCRDKRDEVSSSLKQKAILLAEFVSEAMSGLTQERDCSLPSVDLHLADLMTALKSNLVGLGFVKCGGSLERALLYKVLADRSGLPCALHRATSGHAWCEVAVPELDPEDSEQTEENYPAGLLRANYVVDLTERPGRLLPRGCFKTQRICGPTCDARYTARAPPEVCKCQD
ncbi:unnamed protein product [Parnassius apollo]|uniref:(apollo) hypothetical protein n=1 Tax=Parnassius apollo TaxID=110799 RepID=A0A8S3WTL5_PARAO|nr:unnamed protein product [Parnassius apollo]